MVEKTPFEDNSVYQLRTVLELLCMCITRLKLFFLSLDSENGETKYELCKMSTCIPFYGVPDLAELLGKPVEATAVSAALLAFPS